MNWQIGDVAIIVGCDLRSEFIGMECEIVSLRNPVLPEYFLIDVFGIPMSRGHEPYSIRPIHLKKLPPPNEVTSWDACIFKPSEMEVVR